jgi:molybdate transport system permease protein
VTSRSAGRAALVSAGLLLLAFLALPPLALVLGTSPSELRAGFLNPVAIPAIRLSLFTSGCSALVIAVLGTPLAWSISRGHSRAWRIAETVVQIPIVIPPAVAGIGLLLTFGRKGVLGPLFFGEGLVFTTVAVVLSQIFVAAPFFLQSAISGFRGLDESLLVVARTLGASPSRIFLEVALPLARRPLLAGFAMCWARALSEFGATLLFAGNLSGRTQTMPLAIYTTMESDLAAAQALSLLLMAVGFVVLALLVARGRRTQAPR